MRILDRYVLQKFLLPFIYCFLGFIAIWFIFDLSDNLPDFLQGKVGFDVLLEYYKSQIPEIIVISLPIGALLALLYSLTAMSRSNEIISMLGAGVSVTRFLVPLIFVGLVLTAVTGFFNYESAPHAAMIKKRTLRDIKRGKTTEVGLTGHLYRNREDMRTSSAARFMPTARGLPICKSSSRTPRGTSSSNGPPGTPTTTTSRKVGTFKRPSTVEIGPDGRISKSEIHDEIEISGWRRDTLADRQFRHESGLPVQLERLRITSLSTGTFQKFAWLLIALNCSIVGRYHGSACFVVFIAAPLGIVYSRRGILGSVAAAIALFFSLVFFSSLFVALGKGNRVSPMLATWGPLAAYFLVGLGLLCVGSTNRDFPQIKLPWTS